ncbi:peptidase S41 family protein [Paecilomyces variotii No. 5]|uniref:Peptidase S41 family protein n=1 Tax=Byssochlamys spectabilis (strain No. 5 / NBRC 109023) TaxID=1356009 RepID=V5I655_BYSSN|nr:peptidase S41 family protein [Paecilomyces variotii No. 5]
MFVRLAVFNAIAILATDVVLAATTTEPCALIKNIVSKYANQSDPVTVPAASALNCLQSMPFNTQRAVSFVDEYLKYLEFQSDLEMLARPPMSYMSHAVDLRLGLQGIRARASQNLYSSQFDFDSDIYNLIRSANDGHLYAGLCSLSTFTFGAVGLDPVSLSKDGLTPPQLYVGSDAVLLGKGDAVISPIAFINGVDSMALIESQSSFELFQDPDARFNDMVQNILLDGQGQEVPAMFTIDNVWRGIDAYNLTFANGTERSYPVAARLLPPFPYSTGQGFFNDVCDTQKTSQTVSRRRSLTTRSATKRAPVPHNYPTPVMREAQHNTIAGYYPTHPGLEDVAVLNVPTFETAADDGSWDVAFEFAVTAEWFVGNATKDGKKKIIIDVSNNGGGVVDSGFALLSVFFPNETIYSATRFRSHPAMNYLGQIFNAGDNPQDPRASNSELIVADIVRPDQNSTFGSWKDLFGPYEEGGIPSSGLMAEFDFADEANPLTDPINTDGLGGDLDARTPPFAPENIIIVTDGRCSSTCTVFTDHMISKGVRTVAMGGRPRNGPMQAIGGVKGSQVLDLAIIEQMVVNASSLLNDSIANGKPILDEQELSHYKQVMPIPLEEFPLPIQSASINFLNSYTTRDEDTPTQYVYEAATCHLFYTPDTLLRPENTWALAANATWGSGICVGGLQLNTGLNTTEVTENKSTSDSNPPSRSRAVLGLLMALGSREQ